MKKIVRFLLGQHTDYQIEIGALVSFKAVNQTITGVVKKIKEGKALVESIYLNSNIIQWIDIKKLTLMA